MQPQGFFYLSSNLIPYSLSGVLASECANLGGSFSEAIRYVSQAQFFLCYDSSKIL